MQEGSEALKAGDWERAGNIFEFLLGKEPHNSFYLYALGTVYLSVGRESIAIPLFERSIQLDKDRPWVWNNLGVCFRKQGHVERAREIYAKCLKLEPGNADTLSNISSTYINAGCPQKALEYAERALQISPSLTSAIHHKGIALLELGRFEEGFKFYEGRFGITEWHPRPYKAPLWRGERVKSLLIHGEQGLGDEVLFLGWFDEARKRADRVVIESTSRLVKVFARSFDATVVATVEEVEALGIEFDAVIPMGSLPVACGVESRRNDAYLRADPERVAHYRKRLEELGPGPYVGLSWKGGVMSTHIYLRNGSPEWWRAFPPLATCVSLQYGPEAVVHEMLGIPHWAEAVDDIDELCALIKALDLVITVNNTCVHLAGALGTPCWTLTPSQPAWRYQLSGEKMPWYDSVRQFRQVGTDWQPAYHRAETELADYARVSRETKAAA